MTRQQSSIGLFGFIGRSPDMRRLDDALRALNLHPRLVPEAVKLTICNMLKDATPGDNPAPEAYRSAVELLAYMMLGAEGFVAANGSPLASQCETRIETAVSGGEQGSTDGDLILLAIHAKVLQPSVRDRFDLQAE